MGNAFGFMAQKGMSKSYSYELHGPIGRTVKCREDRVPVLWRRSAVYQARRQLAQAVQRPCSDDRAVLRTDLPRFGAAKPGTVKAATRAERLTADKRRKARAAIYAGLLGTAQAGIPAPIAAVTDGARAVIAADEPAPLPPAVLDAPAA